MTTFPRVQSCQLSLATIAKDALLGGVRRTCGGEIGRRAQEDMPKDKRMDAFAKETFRLGTLRGFKHFEVELRGREELLVTLASEKTSNAEMAKQLQAALEEKAAAHIGRALLDEEDWLALEAWVNVAIAIDGEADIGREIVQIIKNR